MMRSTYPLVKLKQLFPKYRYITQQAKIDADALGLDSEDIARIVCEELGPEHFFKTMPAKKVPGLWQDVYKIEYQGTALYLKLQLSRSQDAVVVISFKEDESPEVR
jgi:hypothetical protein